MIEFECINCQENFEISFTQLMRDGTKLRCPSCRESADIATLESFSENLNALFETIAEIRDVFRFQININSEELPPPYDIQDGESIDPYALDELEDEEEEENELY